jgi:hypothetical protein
VSARTDTLAETEGVVGRENGTEIEDHPGATPGETTMTDHQEEIGTFSMTEGAVVEDDVEIEAIAMADSEEALDANARRVQLHHLRRRSLHQTLQTWYLFWSERGD